MERYAQISGGVVHLVIESETDPDGINGEWIACGDASPGWLYDGSTFAPPAPVVLPKIISKVQYLKRFTQAERVAVREAAKVSPIVDDYIRLMDAASDIDLADPDTVDGVNALEAAGLLAAGRSAEVLA